MPNYTIPALTFALACSLSIAKPAAAAPQAATKSEGAIPRQLIQEIGDHSEMMSNLELLCDDIGPRLTGSERLRKAQAWAMAKLRSYGATNVHEEAYELPRTWTRGAARARLLNANGLSLDIVQWGWTEGTHGIVEGDVVVLNVHTLAEFKAAAPGLAGKVVLVEARPHASDEDRTDVKAYNAELSKAWRDAKISLTLIPSDKAYGLQEMAGGPELVYQSRTAFIAQEHASLLKRLLARGVTPRVQAELGGTFGEKSVQVYNVVADFPGTEKNGEMVIVGAHLDSWDLGSGAADNGAGTVMAMEVLRAMHAAKAKPRRTLRVVLFSGEEQGLLGSKAYLAAHARELDKLQAVLVQDTGSGRISGFPDMKVDAWYKPMVEAMAPAKELGAADLPYGIIGGSDHDPFFEKGIPAFAPIQDPSDYRDFTHHSQADALDHVKKDDLTQCAQVMAVTAWGLMNGERLPHQTSKSTP